MQCRLFTSINNKRVPQSGGGESGRGLRSALEVPGWAPDSASVDYFGLGSVCLLKLMGVAQPQTSLYIAWDGYRQSLESPVRHQNFPEQCPAVGNLKPPFVKPVHVF